MDMKINTFRGKFMSFPQDPLKEGFGEGSGRFWEGFGKVWKDFEMVFEAI